MIKFVDSIDIAPIVQELNNCPNIAWHDTKLWSSPADYNQSTLSQDGVVNKQSVIREQDRLHVIWQADPNGGNQEWWQDSNWRDRAPIITQYGKLFPDTIKTLSDFCRIKDQVLNRLFFSRLTSGQQVYPHRDAPWGTNFEKNTRYGVVITTNPDCTVTSQGHVANPEPGTVFWFDNSQEHSAVNNGLTDRIYLYMDIKPRI
jgi:hypothetical protein